MSESTLELKVPGKLVSRHENVRYLGISGPVSGQSKYPMRKANTDLNVLVQGAELNSHRRI